ncbi:EAL domain-containing protein [Pseudoalteromonas sp. MMG010]|uniref:putative bifunctional diguanylate cyclase/phosphodiesterase n=1 Tax=Pseudoalteromonas sp. MMG010 TaxID=2822685 RepID=UPI001B3A55CE|nr:EAL domain-containing protein [Pseudoalteromonas sp. MMG010]MBQ4834038.1 EAL domain-containing protein [Pseudoalteromonas sp. MMG010]
MFQSIRYKFISITIISILITSSLVFLSSINEHKSLYSHSVKENLDAMSSNIADNLLRIMSEQHDMFAITTELLGLDRYEHIKFVNVFDENWQLIQSYVHPNYLKLKNYKPTLNSIAVNQLPFSVTEIDEGLAALKPIGEASYPIGYLLIVQDLKKPLAQSKSNLFNSTIPFVIVVVILAIAFSFWVYQHLLKPLLQLSKFTRKVEKTTDYKLQYKVSGKDEVSQLGNDINNLLQTINGQIKTNRKHTAKLLEQKHAMERLANYDILTGLPNRIFFLEQLRLALKETQKNQQELAILFFDIDNFKGVNDTLGHETGDKLLKSVADKIKSHLRAEDIIARIGGDEFLIMLPNLDDLNRAIDTAKRIINLMHDPIKINNWDVQTGVSIGVVSAQQANYNIDVAITNADIAMYTAKEQGKGTYTVFNPELLADNQRKIQIANLINQAINENEFELYYQLKINKSGKAKGLEALIRWPNSALGFISPGEFIPIAEQAGKIKAITRWVLTQVFKNLESLKQLVDEDVLVSLNISSHDLQDPCFIDIIKEKVVKYNCDLKHIQFEITESSYLDHFSNANEFFHDIKAMQGSIALDDFGTGYSSLSYLTQIEIDTLKIDRMFVNQLDNSSKNAVVLQTILDLGKRLDLTICCEGIETPEQAHYLLENNADDLQGFYFAKPVPIERLASEVANAEKLFSELTVVKK